MALQMIHDGSTWQRLPGAKRTQSTLTAESLPSVAMRTSFATISLGNCTVTVHFAKTPLKTIENRKLRCSCHLNHALQESQHTNGCRKRIVVRSKSSNAEPRCRMKMLLFVGMNIPLDEPMVRLKHLSIEPRSLPLMDEVEVDNLFRLQ